MNNPYNRMLPGLYAGKIHHNLLGPYLGERMRAGIVSRQRLDSQLNEPGYDPYNSADLLGTHGRHGGRFHQRWGRVLRRIHGYRPNC